jgi:hypothetical protein
LRALVDAGALLNCTIAVVQAKGSRTEVNAYRAAVGKVMGELWVRAIVPLIEAHPSLAPKALRAKKPKVA